MKRYIPLLAMGLFVLMTGSVMADPINVRPISFGPGSGEPAMQVILDSVVGSNQINAGLDQNGAAIWVQDEQDVSAYKIVSYASYTGSLGIYSFSNGTEVVLSLTDGSGSFWIGTDGALHVNGVATPGFGSAFGFFYRVNDGDNVLSYYTEDDKNGNDEARALAYLVEQGMNVNLGGGRIPTTASGNNDWIIGFEDGELVRGAVGDGDYNDAVFYVEDVKAVPEPSSLLLFGSGLVGLAAIGRKKLMK